MADIERSHNVHNEEESKRNEHTHTLSIHTHILLSKSTLHIDDDDDEKFRDPANESTADTQASKCCGKHLKNEPFFFFHIYYVHIRAVTVISYFAFT